MCKLWLKLHICYIGLVWHYFFPNNMTMKGSWIARERVSGINVYVCVYCMCASVKERAISSPNTITRAFTVAPEAIPTHLQGGRQVNEKLLILPLYPRRWGEVTLILPNFVFPLSFDGAGRSVATPGLWGRGEQRRGGSMWAVMPSAAFSERIKGGQWRWGGTEGAVNPGPAPLPSFREREREREWERAPLVREAQSHFTRFHSEQPFLLSDCSTSSDCGEQV